MKWILLLVVLFPLSASALTFMGVDDRNPVLSAEEDEKLDNAVVTYFRAPSVERINIVLDIMNGKDLLRKKTAWAPLIGFLTVVFENNKNHVFAWMCRNDYTNYAQQVFVDALLHAKLKESAYVFAQAHHWNDTDMNKLLKTNDELNLKKIEVILPGHIDTLWGAFFASGDPVYVNSIIDSLFRDYVPYSAKVMAPVLDFDVVGENKKLAESSLRIYVKDLPEVKNIVKKRMDKEKDKKNKRKLKEILSAAK